MHCPPPIDEQNLLFNVDKSSSWNCGAKGRGIRADVRVAKNG